MAIRKIISGKWAIQAPAACSRNSLDGRSDEERALGGWAHTCKQRPRPR
ncbi:MAG: hypothetical protein IPI52_16090 [Bacteroidetes bacterium]|nr:hypothetical protein [Bacteroidota bacterium]